MIENENQYQITKKWIDNFKTGLKDLKAAGPFPFGFKQLLISDALESQLADLEKEAADFEDLQKSKNRDYLSAQIGDTKRILAGMQDNDYLGRIGFEHRLEVLEKRLLELPPWE